MDYKKHKRTDHADLNKDYKNYKKVIQHALNSGNDYKRTDLEMVFSGKLTENFDDAYNTTGNVLLDILFMSEYYQNNLFEVPDIGENETSKLFAMMMRDPRFGLGRRDLGRHLMIKTGVRFENMVKAGRFDDLLEYFREDYCDGKKAQMAAQFMMIEAINGNALAKKWLPRFGNKDDKIAKAICALFNIHPKEYRKIIKEDSTVEYKLTHDEVVNYEHVPSLAMIKYFEKFKRDDGYRFEEYLESVKTGKKKLNVSTTTVYDIYRNRDKIDADLFIDQIEKVEINAIPILDTSSSMMNQNDSYGKAASIAHYIGKNSTFAPNKVISFSSEPQLMTIDANKARGGYWGGFGNDDSNYTKELNSIYTGDISNTDFGKVMRILEDLNEFPDFLVVLSDMEFDEGSSMSKDTTMRLFKERGAHTKIVWWNFNSRSMTAPETDTYGNVFLSGYNAQLLKYLEAGFDGEQFLIKLLDEYAKNVL